MTGANFIETLKPILNNHAPANLRTLGLLMAILESGSGNSELARKANNLYGIKKGSWTGPTYSIRHKDYLPDPVTGQLIPFTRVEEFRRYKSWDSSVKDWVRLLSRANRYRPVMEARNIQDQISAIANSGYATDPKYAQKLNTILSGLPGNQNKNTLSMALLLAGLSFVAYKTLKK